MDDWIEKIKSFYQKFILFIKKELDRTTNIGKKMFSASKANTTLNESYENLGRLAFEEMHNKNLSWHNDKAKVLFEQINQCNNDLEKLESDLEKIKQEE
jgi:hypothetical protein